MIEIGRPRARGVCAALLVALVCAGCNSNASSDGGTASIDASCAFRLQFGGHIYKDVGNVEFKIDADLGEGHLLACDDGNGEGGAPGTLEVFAMHGFDTDQAVAVGDSNDNARFFVREDMSNQEIKDLIDSKS